MSEDAPIVRARRGRIVYANFYDQVELACEVSSASGSPVNLTWQHFARPLVNNYKHNVSTRRTHQQQQLGDGEERVVSTLLINSLNALDLGDYECVASNELGARRAPLVVRRKSRPEAPRAVRASHVTSSSLVLTWSPGDNGGEASHYLLQVNGQLNLTVASDIADTEADTSSSSTNGTMSIELRGLSALTDYHLTLFAYNSMGTSDPAPQAACLVRTTRTTNSVARLPLIRNAQFDEIREAICFELAPPPPPLFSTFMSAAAASVSAVSSSSSNSNSNNKPIHLGDLLIQLQVSHVVAASPPPLFLATGNRSQSQVEAANSDEENEVVLQDEVAVIPHTISISLARLKYGHNCVLYSQLIEFEEANKFHNTITSEYNVNTTNATATADQRRRIFYLSHAMNAVAAAGAGFFSSSSNRYVAYHQFGRNKTSQSSSSASPASLWLSRSFADFKRNNRVNVSVCFSNETSVCGQDLVVFGKFFFLIILNNFC